MGLQHICKVHGVFIGGSLQLMINECGVPSPIWQVMVNSSEYWPIPILPYVSEDLLN